MRIALVAHLSEVSGAGVALVDTACALASAGHQVSLILPGNQGLDKRAEARGLQPVIISNQETALGDSSSRQRVQLLKGRANYMAQLAQFFREEKIDLVYINSSASVFAGIAAKVAGRPVAWHIHETLDQRDRRTRVKIWMIRRLATGLIYASKSALAAFPPGTLPSMIARNAIDFENLSQIREDRLRSLAANSSLTGPPCLFLNGTIRRKGADLLLRAAAILVTRQPDLNFRILITGSPDTDPPFYRELASLASQPILSGRVELAGIMPTFLPVFARATAFISASRNEAMPISIVEAMAAGVSVIATDVGDCAELLDNGTAGVIIPPESSDALADAIEQLLKNPEKAAARTDRAFEKAKSLYGGADFWKPLEDFLLKLAAEPITTRR